MAARKNKVELSETWKDGIRVSQIMKRLYDHATGDKELMTISQINAAKVILNKLVPDLARTEVSGQMDLDMQADVHLNVFGELLKNLKMQKQLGE
jgi:hypothetical protein